MPGFWCQSGGGTGAYSRGRLVRPAGIGLWRLREGGYGKWASYGGRHGQPVHMFLLHWKFLVGCWILKNLPPATPFYHGVTETRRGKHTETRENGGLLGRSPFTDMPTRFIASTASNTTCTLSSPGTQSRMSGGSRIRLRPAQAGLRRDMSASVTLHLHILCSCTHV